jgi:3-dehydroquinate dehydratase/shikimate dehydrogenase
VICATILEDSTSAVLARMLEASPRADLLEVRADAVAPGELDLAAVIAKRPRPLLVTCRPVREGGLWRGTEEARLALLREAAARGAETIDLEWDSTIDDLPADTRVLVSRHDFGGALEPEAGLASLRGRARAFAQKLALTVTDARQGLDLLERAAREKKPTIAIGMGFPGVATRLLGERAGAPWVYAAAGAAAAPGQLSLDALKKLLHGRRVTPRTNAFGILGKPVAHSRSPALMNAVFGTIGVDAIYTWLETEDPAAILAATRGDEGWRGFGVTIPHKETIARACDRLSKDAQATGAVNTVVRSQGEWVGHNTDAPAVALVLGRAAAARGTSLSGLPVDLLGAGGAARAAAFALAGAGSTVTVHDRTEERGRRLAAELGVAFGGPLAAVRATGKPRAIVNATSVGMAPDPSATPVEGSAFDAHTIAFDLVYTPEATRFLGLAAERGALPVSGMELFLGQARLQLELWLGRHVAQRVSDEWLALRARGA